MKSDKTQVKKRLNIVKGQLDGISKMMDDDAYCIDISNQILASISALKKINNMIIADHIRCCVMDSKGTKDEEEKLKELEKTLQRMTTD